MPRRELDVAGCSGARAWLSTRPAGRGGPRPDVPTGDSYTYAPNGNLLTQPGIAGIYAYDPSHPHAVQTAGAHAFTYDPVGNQITRSGTTVTYTAFNMPKAFTPAPGQGGVPITLDYDGDQQRVRKTAGDEVTVYAGGLYERTTNTKTSAVEHRYFVHGSERVVAVVTRSSAPTSEEKTRYLHVDNLGSVETVTDETGSKSAEKRSYDAFGARRNPSWGAATVAFSSLTTRGFTGHEDDQELGLVNMKGRLYDPKVGRFLTTDPIVSHPGFGQSWNPYSYVLNNPLAFTDPSGFGDDPLAPFSPGCTHCVGGTSRDGATTVTWVYDGPITPRPPNVDASLSGLSTMPVDLSATGNATASTPQTPAETTCGPATQAAVVAPGSFTPPPPRLFTPGKQPVPFYIGNDAHRQIAEEYKAARPSQKVYTNTTPLVTIAKELGLSRAALAGADLLRPDILNATTREIYEIKPSGSEPAARLQLAFYSAALARAGLVVTPGGSGPGTRGTLPAPGGYYQYWAPEPGVISYRWVTPRSPLWGIDPVVWAVGGGVVFTVAAATGVGILGLAPEAVPEAVPVVGGLVPAF